MTMLAGFAALAIDVGPLYSVRADLQNAADAAALEAQPGTYNPKYVDEDGNPVTYTTIGESGMESKNKDALNSRKVEVVGFSLHDLTSGSGSKLDDRNVGIR